MNIINKFLLFCSSYSPLLIIFPLLIIDFNNINFNSIFIIIISAILIVLGLLCLYINIFSESTGNHTIKIRSVENKNELMHTYLLPYIVFILSFIDPTFSSSINKILSIIIFIIILFIVYINSDLFLLDIILISFKYKYYKVTSDNNEVIIITKENLYSKINEEINVKIINDNLFKY